MPDVTLYDANGGYVATASLDEAPTSESSIEANGHVYVWNHRNGQFREVGPSIIARMHGSYQNKMIPQTDYTDHQA